MCRVDIYNESKGDLTGYNCEKCKNRGYLMATNSQGYDYLIECECMKMRKLIQVAQNCGLGDALKKCKESYNNGRCRNFSIFAWADYDISKSKRKRFNSIFNYHNGDFYFFED